MFEEHTLKSRRNFRPQKSIWRKLNVTGTENESLNVNDLVWMIYLSDEATEIEL